MQTTEMVNSNETNKQAAPRPSQTIITALGKAKAGDRLSVTSGQMTTYS